MQSRQNVARHSRRDPLRGNTQRLPLLASLLCASLTSCILEQRNGSDTPDLTTLPDLRADLGLQCGDGVYVPGIGANPGTCTYDFYQPDAMTCTSASVMLYNNSPTFKQTCNCACDNSSMLANVYYGALCGGTPISIGGSTKCQSMPSGGGNVNYDLALGSGSCAQNSTASWTAWRLEPAGSNYCLLSKPAHDQNPAQECILIDSSISSCPTAKYTQRYSLFTASSAPAPLISSCNCCAPSDYPDIPVFVFQSTDCSGIPLAPAPKKPACLGLGAGIIAYSAGWNKNHCPQSYAKYFSVTTQTPTTASQTVCCKK
jgi:hypothetical protein